MLYRRKECSLAEVHRPLSAGIASSGRGAFSVIVSGSYGDEDEGYTMQVLQYSTDL
jgi:hypothetical protein